MISFFLFRVSDHAIKIGRHKYYTSLTLACKDALILNPGELTVMYRDYIEDAIRQQPEMYLWSHKHFKFEWGEGNKHLWIVTKPGKFFSYVKISSAHWFPFLF